VARVLGVDLGSRRIGLACSDATGTIASPLRVLERSGTHLGDHRAIVAAARDEEATRIVVGLPLSLSGDVGPAAQAALDEVEELRVVAGDELPVDVHDERLTTVTAERSLLESGMKRQARTRVRDAVAAAVMLQSYLEAPR
jgi:putative Holliday junction resolvase